MATDEDKQPEMPSVLADEVDDLAPARVESAAIVNLQGGGDSEKSEDDNDAPIQFGYTRFVYAAYFAGAILVAFVLEKTIRFGWFNLAKWRPNFGEPSDELIMPLAAIMGVLVALYYWKRTRTRELMEDVASELAKVTWPSKKEVANNTMVVIFTTTFATIFFTLMDRFWSFVTNWVYGT
jgi:preprotein translocase subunit SecE